MIFTILVFELITLLVLHTLIDICITTGVNPFGAISDGCAFSDAHKTTEHKQRQKDKLKESEIF